MFDAKKFRKTKYTKRTEDIDVPDLAQFFPEGEKPVWKIAGLTGQELGNTKEAAQKNKNFAAMIDAISSTNSKDKVEGIKTALGIGDISDNLAERIEQLVTGSIEPQIDIEIAVLLCERYPVDFYNITNKILILTGQGMKPGELKSSGKTAPSEQV